MDCIKLSFGGGGEDLCDVPWAAKNYACSFCRREFRSAQALGGHMNVHRRDRARLRLQLPSTLSSETCLEAPDNPNPSSFLTSSSSVKSCLPYNYSSSHPLVSPSVRSLASPSRDENKKPKFDHGLNLFPKKGMRGVSYIDEEMLKGFAQEDLDHEEFNKADLKKDNNSTIQQDMELELDLHLELGFFKDDHKEEVDLELRLGHL